MIGKNINDHEFSFYNSSEFLFPIYKYESEYYLIDVLGSPYLLFLGGFRQILFPFKAYKIPEDELYKFKKERRTCGAPINYKVISLIAVISTLGAKYFRDFIDRIDLCIPSRILTIVFIIVVFIIQMYFVYKRKKSKFSKLEFNDGKFKMVAKNKTIWFIWVICTVFSYGTINALIVAFYKETVQFNECIYSVIGLMFFVLISISFYLPGDTTLKKIQ